MGLSDTVITQPSSTLFSWFLLLVVDMQQVSWDSKAKLGFLYYSLLVFKFPDSQKTQALSWRRLKETGLVKGWQSNRQYRWKVEGLGETENKRNELLLDAKWDPGWARLKLCLCRLHLSLFLLPCFSWNMLFGKLQSTSRCRSISLHFPYSGNSAWFQLSGTRHTLFVHLTHHLLQQKYKNNVYMRWKHFSQTSAHLRSDTTSTSSSYF